MKCDTDFIQNTAEAKEEVAYSTQGSQRQLPGGPYALNQALKGLQETEPYPVGDGEEKWSD